MATPFLSFDYDPGLGAGVGSSAVNEVRTELKRLSRDLRNGCPCCQDLLEVPPTRLQEALHVMTEMAQTLCFFSQRPSAAQSTLYLKTCGSSLHLQTEMTVRVDENIPVFFSSTSPSPDP